MSRIATSVASFSWQRAAVRRACSSGVSRGSVLSSSRCSLLTLRVQPETLDLRGDGRLDEAVDRLAARPTLTDLGRRNRDRLELEEEDAVGRREASARLAQLLVGDARPHRHPEARELEHALGALPPVEVGELVAADDEDRVPQPPGFE